MNFCDYECTKENEDMLRKMPKFRLLYLVNSQGKNNSLDNYSTPYFVQKCEPFTLRHIKI